VEQRESLPLRGETERDARAPHRVRPLSGARAPRAPPPRAPRAGLGGGSSGGIAA